jgi:hypothetical protein
VIASCEIGKKKVSVCGHSKRATYRFGRPGKIELEGDDLRYNFTGYSGGGESQIALSRGSWRYVIYDGMIRTGFRDGHNDPRFYSGLLVLRKGHVVSDRNCGGLYSYLASGVADHYMPRGPETDHELHLDF